MPYKISILLLISGFFFASCNNDPEGNLELVFKGTWGDDPLTIFTNYLYMDGQQIQFSKSDFYISDVRLVRTNGTTDEVLDVELVDLSFSSAADAEIGFVVRLNNVEAVSYERIDFGIGLNPTQNAGRPEDYPSDSPLAAPRYWEPWTSYIFAKTEGQLDTVGDGTPDMGWLYHTGTDPLFVGLSAPAVFTVPDEGTTRVVFTMDHEKLLGMPDDPINIKSKPINHNPLDTNEIIKLTENYPGALSFIVE